MDHLDHLPLTNMDQLKDKVAAEAAVEAAAEVEAEFVELLSTNSARPL